MISEQPQVRYDVTAIITYMLTGLGIGYVCALLFGPRSISRRVSTVSVAPAEAQTKAEEQSPAL